MLVKLFLLAYLSSSTIEAFPSESVQAAADSSEKTEKSCDEKLEWYRATAEQTKEMFDKYEKQIKEHPFDNHVSNVIEAAQDLDKVKHVEDEVGHFKEKITDALNKYSDAAGHIANISDTTARLAFCREKLTWSALWNKNLTTTGADVKRDVMNLLKFLGVPKDIQDSFDKTLSKIVNFLFIIDMTKNIFKDVNSLVRESFTKTEQGVALEKQYEFGENGKLVEIGEEIDEKYKELLEDNAEDKRLQENLNELEDDTEIKAAEDRAKEREEERERNAEESNNEAEDEGVKSEPIEEPFKFEFNPVVLRQRG